VGFRAGLEVVAKEKISCPHRETNSGRPARSKYNLYVRLRINNI